MGWGERRGEQVSGSCSTYGEKMTKRVSECAITLHVIWKKPAWMD